MTDRAYKQRTKILGIPVVGDQDRIYPEVELKKYQIIENLLLAGLKGAFNCIFDEGDMVIEENNDNFSVKILACGNKPAIEGVVGSAYFLISDMIEWNDLNRGKFYYLYITRTNHTFSNSSSIRTIATEYEQKNKNVILIGSVDAREEKIILNRTPKGKILNKELREHIINSDNSHGKNIVQDEITVRKRLTLGDGFGTEIIIHSEKEKITLPVSCLIPNIISFKSNGIEGIEITATNRVAFTQVSRESGKEGMLGEISVGYYGQDKNVKNFNNFIVYNEGDKDIPLRALIYYG